MAAGRADGAAAGYPALSGPAEPDAAPEPDAAVARAAEAARAAETGGDA